METAKLKKFAQRARRSLIEQVSAKLDLVLAADSAARRESAGAVKQLEEAIAERGKARVADRVAYIWFNRFCALRFMDVNRYTRIGVVSPAEEQLQPEILADAKSGHIDKEMVPDSVRQQVLALLDGTAPSRDPQGEAYRLLLVAACNAWHKAMPFLFQRIDDYTELLMPDDLLSGNSILAHTRKAMTPEACEDVEVIGWLYQFYISEKKDEVFAGLKKNQKITPENIPAATQLFTPHWIVRYLVENSLGRLWMLNRPDSKIIEQMDYYIKPDQPETDFLRIGSPEEIKICDPACGSGHMLTYAFDLLHAIYEEEGYESAEIPEKILTNNLYGIEIDERAGELAAFALTMKARARQRRFFNKGVKPNICVLEAIRFDKDELDGYMDFIGRDLFTESLQTTLCEFEEAGNFGSLIRPTQTDVSELHRTLQEKRISGQLFLSHIHDRVLNILRQLDFLSPQYHAVVANPPYMGHIGMNGRLATWLKKHYTDVKSDLFSAFIIRNLEFSLPGGQCGFMSPYTWMFISTHEKLRRFLIKHKTITSLVQLEYSGFDGATVPICTFTVENAFRHQFKAGYVKLSNFRGPEIQGSKTIEAINNTACGWFHRASAEDFKEIPGNPIAYWIGDQLRDTFSNSTLLGDLCDFRIGMATGKNDLYVRQWYEVSFNKIGLNCSSRAESVNGGKKWFPYAKGGGYRKWSGNKESLVNWESDGRALQTKKHPSGKRIWAHNFNLYQIFKPAICWTVVTSSKVSFRLHKEGFLFDAAAGLCQQKPDVELHYLAGLLNSVVADLMLPLINPTLNLHPGYLSNLPSKSVDEIWQVQALEELAESDWDSYETSWNFERISILKEDYKKHTLTLTYQYVNHYNKKRILEMQRIEEHNNRVFINAYGLENQLVPEVPLNEITLTCNPWYRYSNTNKEAELEAFLLADTMREFVSYAVGCMFGRYALRKPGLILANQGETIQDYLKQIPEPSFPADEDNVIPLLNGNWFPDDITERFCKFLRITFGEEHYEENLRFVEDGLNIKGRRKYSIRDYFLGEFYADHVKCYKKRPIYWLFSSPKGSFNALIYMHRYRPETVSIVLNDYLREFRAKLASHKSHLEAVNISTGSSQGEKSKALKEIEKINKMIVELENYERDVLYPLATRQIEIDLDDGVKVNYPKFGTALKKVIGLSA